MQKKITSNIFKTFIILIVVLLIIISVGLFNVHNFQKRAIADAEIIIQKHISKQNENLLKFVNSDYSSFFVIPDLIEISAVTNKNTYYVELFVTNSRWETMTALNIFARPKLKIMDIHIRNL